MIDEFLCVKISEFLKKATRADGWMTELPLLPVV